MGGCLGKRHPTQPVLIEVETNTTGICNDHLLKLVRRRIQKSSHAHGGPRTVLVSSRGFHTILEGPSSQFVLTARRGGNECPVCLDPILPSDSQLGLVCGHVFHGECLAQWLSQQQNCPMCRAPASALKKLVVFKNPA